MIYLTASERGLLDALANLDVYGGWNVTSRDIKFLADMIRRIIAEMDRQEDYEREQSERA